jgi:hypothetical protein
VTRTMKRSKVGWLVNNELENMRKEVSWPNLR